MSNPDNKAFIILFKTAFEKCFGFRFDPINEQWNARGQKAAACHPDADHHHSHDPVVGLRRQKECYYESQEKYRPEYQIREPGKHYFIGRVFTAFGFVLSQKYAEARNH